MSEEKDPEFNNSTRNALATAGIAFSIPGSFAGPIFLGYWLDKRFNTTPILFIVGFLLGCFAVVVEVRTLMKKAK